MRTNGKKIFYIAVALVVVGLLVGCEEAKVVLPTGGKSELKIEYLQPAERESQTKLVITGSREVKVSANSMIWLYDIPEDQPEYLLQTYLFPAGWQYYLHLHISRKPPASQ